MTVCYCCAGRGLPCGMLDSCDCVSQCEVCRHCKLHCRCPQMVLFLLKRVEELSADKPHVVISPCESG